MEILDVWKNLHSQVVGLQKRQVQAFPETLAPKTQRDLASEVGVDKAVEAINRTLEQKLGALEFVVQNFEKGIGIRDLSRADNKGILTQSFQVTNSTGDIIPLWNSIVRSYQAPGLSRESQNIIKVKIQDLTANLEAMVYGLNETVEYIFEQPFTELVGPRGGTPARRARSRAPVGAPAGAEEEEQKEEPRRFKSENALVILDYLRTLSLYKLIKQQVDSGNLELISVDMMNSSFKNIFDSLSADRLELLKRVAPRGILGQSSIRNIPAQFEDFNQRLDALGEELGVKFRPMDYKVLSKLPKRDVDSALNTLRNESHPIRSRELASLDRLLAPIEEESKQLVMLKSLIQYNKRLLGEYNNEIEMLQQEEKVPEGEFMDEVEEPVEPVFPRVNAFPDGAEYVRALHTYEQEFAHWQQQYTEYQLVRQHNDFVREVRGMNQVQRQMEAENLVKERDELQQKIQADENEKREKSVSISRKKGTFNVRKERIPPMMQAQAEKILDALIDIGTKQSLSESLPADFPKRDRPAGRGKPVDTRGLASMRHNYGCESDSSHSSSDSDSESDEEEKKKVLNFDDTRNDHYSHTRPYRR